MKEAFRLLSFHGMMKDKKMATEVKSPSDARKLGPFVDENKKPLSWVNWSKPNRITGKKTRPYFRHYRSIGIGQRKIIEEELREREIERESDIHRNAKNLLAVYLREELKENRSIFWAFKDEKYSQFSLSGNLLSDVKEIVTEHNYSTPFGIKYKFDLALIGEKITKEPIILGAIELEKEHRFDLLKCLISKSLGFPLFSINIEDLKLSNINIEWCKNALSETTQNSGDELRRNYIYLHNFLYSIYLNIPSHVRYDYLKHQYIVFCKEDSFEKLYNFLKIYISHFNLVNIVTLQQARLNEKDVGSMSMFENEGSIAGNDWKNINSNRYIRLTAPVTEKKQGNLYQFHLILARLFNAHFNTLVGYKYTTAIRNEDKLSEIWSNEHASKIIMKNMSEPIFQIIDFLKSNNLIHSSIKQI